MILIFTATIILKLHFKHTYFILHKIANIILISFLDNFVDRPGSLNSFLTN